MSAHERSGWRDERISKRHRLYGFDCPATDIDFLMVEYDHAIPRALVDYKHVRSGETRWDTANHEAVSRLADRSGIPYLIAHYEAPPDTDLLRQRMASLQAELYWATRSQEEHWWYRVTPVNARAKELFVPETILSESEWVDFLYRQLRGRPVPEVVRSRLHTFRPRRAA